MRLSSPRPRVSPLRVASRLDPDQFNASGFAEANRKRSDQLIFAVNCITTNNVTIDPIATARPVKPSKKNAYANPTRYTSCASAVSRYANRFPTATLIYDTTRNNETAEQITKAVSSGM